MGCLSKCFIIPLGAELNLKYGKNHIGVFRFSLADDEHVDYFLNKLLQHNRPFSAARIIVFSKYSNSEKSIKISAPYLSKIS